MDISNRECRPFKFTKNAGNGRGTNVLHCKLGQKNRDKYPYSLMTEGSGLFHAVNYPYKPVGKYTQTLPIHLADNDRSPKIIIFS